MRACMLAYTFYETDSRVMRYAESLARQGHEVDVFALRHKGQQAVERINGVTVLRIQRRVVSERSMLSYMAKIVGFFVNSGARLSLRHLRRPYRLIHVHSVPDFEVFAALLPKLGGARIILDIHDIVPEFYASKFGAHRKTLIRLLLWLERLSCRFADHVIAANHIWSERLIQRSVPADKCTVFLNYPDPALFHPHRPHPANSRPVLMYPGSLNAHQGLRLAIEAVSLVRAAGQTVELHIYGEGPEKPGLIELTAQLQLNDCVRIMPLLPIAEVAARMANADLGVVPKRRESFGNEAFSTKILEFMALGVPVVAANTRIDTYYFDASLIQFFESGSAADLAAKILELLRNPARGRQLAERGIEHAARNSWSVHEQRYLALASRLVQGPRPAEGSAAPAPAARAASGWPGRVAVGWHILRSGYLPLLWSECLRRFWSVRISYGFERDLRRPFDPPPPAIPVKLRELREEDIPVLLSPADARTPIEAKHRFIRQAMLSAGIRTCYVAATADDRACHMQWMIAASENERLRKFSSGGLPPLADDEVLLENVFTLEAYRRKGIELWAVRQLFEKARAAGARRAVVFVQQTNAVSLKMMTRLGFTPFLRKTDRRRFFVSRFSFESLPPGTPNPLAPSAAAPPKERA